jgi:hypothetical protein
VKANRFSDVTPGDRLSLRAPLVIESWFGKRQTANIEFLVSIEHGAEPGTIDLVVVGPDEGDPI